MQIPKPFNNYRCSDYFNSDVFVRGVWSPSAQLWLIVAAKEVVEHADIGFLVIGRPGFDGIEFGYRRGFDGIWAHYPIEDDFRLVAPDVSALVEGWLSGAISI